MDASTHSRAEFAADDLGHELRTLAASISATVEVLETGDHEAFPGGRERLLDILERSCERLLAVSARARSSYRGAGYTELER